mgnify:FL=1
MFDKIRHKRFTVKKDFQLKLSFESDNNEKILLEIIDLSLMGMQTKSEMDKNTSINTLSGNLCI